MVLDLPFDFKQIAGILDRLPDLVVVMSPIDAHSSLKTDFQIRYCNLSAQKALKINVNTTLADVACLDELTKKHLGDQCSLALQRRETMTFEFYSPALDRQIHVTYAPIPPGVLITMRYLEVPRQLGTGNDRTYLSTLLLDAAPYAMMLVEPIRLDDEIINFRVVVANERMAVLVRTARNTLENNLCSQLNSEFLKKHVVPILSAVFESGESAAVEFFEEREEKWFEAKVSRTRESFLSITVADVTQLRNNSLAVAKLREEAEDALHALNRSNERLTEFTYVASHDLNEPLRKILTFSKMLHERFTNSLDNTAVDYLSRIEKTAVRMQGLLDDLLVYSRVTKRPVKLDKVSLPQLLKEVMKELEPRIREKGARLEIKGLPEIEGDSGQLKQLFIHLLNNALKFQRKESTPEITISATDGHEKNGQLLYSIEVSDNGIGFDNNEAAKIFELFYRLHARHEYEGNGVGLAIVQRIMENHNGYCDAASLQSGGASFRLHFPA